MRQSAQTASSLTSCIRFRLAMGLALCRRLHVGNSCVFENEYFGDLITPKGLDGWKSLLDGQL